MREPAAEGRVSLAPVTGTTIQLCGRFVVLLDGRRVDGALPGRQGRLLFAYLALNRDRPVGRDELMEVVWPDELPRDPGDAFGALLSKVRSAVGAAWLEGRSELLLRLPADVDIDVERALAAVHRAESACAREDWASAWSASVAARAVAQRTLLGEHDAAWLDEWRRSLADVLVRSLECYVRACLGLGGPERAGAVRTARFLVATSPLRESGYDLLMAALEAQGNIAEAIEVYKEAARVLQDELGVAPAPFLQARSARLVTRGA